MCDFGFQFENCSNLSKINLSITGGFIPKYSFCGCSRLKNINIAFTRYTSLEFQMEKFQIDTYALERISSDAEVNIYFPGNKSNQIRICDQGLDHKIRLNYFRSDRSKIVTYYSSNSDLEFFDVNMIECGSVLEFKEMVGWK